MTVAELIAKLSAFPASMPVVVSGFDEFGYEDVDTVAKVRLFEIGPGAYRQDDEIERQLRPRVNAQPFEAVHVNF
ncbi:hypothetical protein [Mesorhizobium sp.]|uniref:hypothetical protein n=1 Tax=Mesorhizobium sp. TaxID=1871066 RepID=UPI000FE9FCA0|nr:hypothetical protein [Mesorhizobium sp.]RWE37427.1 MAG: hypothetical protein EOS77_02285 [Mesorhizobium sp.]